MKDTYIFGIQTNIDGTMRDLTRARDCIARGDYTVAQMLLLTAAEKLTGAAQWQFAATGTNNATTPDDAAQIYNNAIKHNLERAKNDTTDPETLQTVADLRAQLKAGDDDAAQLVNDLVSDNPNQVTAWMTRADLDRCADDLTDSQRDELMHYMRTEYEMIDIDAEITNARENLDM